VKIKKLLFHFIPYRKYVLTTERTKESVLRTLRRITGKSVFPPDYEFYGNVGTDEFRIRYNVRYRMDLNVENSFPPIMNGTIQEANAKTVISISTKLPTSYCITFGFVHLITFIGLLLGLFFMCAGNFHDGLPLLLICGVLPLGQQLLMCYSAVNTAERAIKRLSHLLFAEQTDSDNPSDENE